MAVHGVTKSQTRLSNFPFTFHFPALEKEMATHSSVLAWRIPGTGEPGGRPSMGLHRVGHDWSNLAAAAAVLIYTSLGPDNAALWGLQFCGSAGFKPVSIKPFALAGQIFTPTASNLWQAEARLEVGELCPPSFLLSCMTTPNKTQVKDITGEACFRSSLSGLWFSSAFLRSNWNVCFGFARGRMGDCPLITFLVSGKIQSCAWGKGH